MNTEKLIVWHTYLSLVNITDFWIRQGIFVLYSPCPMRTTTLLPNQKKEKGNTSQETGVSLSDKEFFSLSKSMYRFNRIISLVLDM